MRAQLSLIENEYRVHPAAAIFPMMDESDLKTLAADIKENGLRVPIVLDKSGEVLIDGRNRLRACEMAEVKPTFQHYEGDATDYVLSLNVERRHMSKSQIAMAVVKINPDPAKRGRGNKTYSENTFSRDLASKARTVLAMIPDLADAVITGGMPLNEAYEKAQAVKKQREEDAGWMNRFREEEPDLAESVEAGSMPMMDARQEWHKRFNERMQEKHRHEDRRKGVTQDLQSALQVFYPEGHVNERGIRDRADSLLENAKREYWRPGIGLRLSIPDLEACLKVLELVVQGAKEGRIDD